MEKWKPIGKMVLVTKDEDKKTTSGGIILPDTGKIPVITCRVLMLGPQVDVVSCPITEFDRIVVDPTNAIPITFESNEKRYLINSDNILAVQVKDPTRKRRLKTNVEEEFSGDD